jgi:hypothetical protein
MALRAGGNAPNITAFHFRESVALLSGQCGVPQWPGTTKLSRGVGQQRGHVSPPVAALGGNGTSPLYPVRCSVVSASGHGGVPPYPSATKLSRGVRGSCGARPLRPPASLLHNAALPSVPASRCAKAPLGAGHRCAPYRVKATGVMQSGLRWRRSHSRRRFPVVARPTRRHLRALVVVVAPWHQPGAARCVVGQWPAASHVVCTPAHPCASPLRGISPARWSARPPPVGAPSARAPWLLVFAIGLVAAHVRNTGATGRNGL